MARTVTASYETERAKIATAPVYYCDFRHVKTQGDGVDYGFSRHFATGTVASPTVTKLPYMMRVSGNIQTVEPELGRSSIGRLRLDFLDVKADGTNGEFLKYVSEGRLTLSGAHTNVVTTMTISGSTTGYPTVGTIEVTAGSGAKERIRYTGKGASTFTGCTRGVDGTANVAYSGGEQVRNGEQIRAGQRVVLYAGYDVLTEANYMSFSKMEVVEVSLLADGLTFSIECADILRTTRKTIFLTATEEAPVALSGNPLTLLLQVLISTGAGTNWSGAGTNYDVLNVNNGLAIPYQLVDVAGIEALRTSDFPSDTYTFSMTTPQLGKDFLEVEICKTTNCYPLVKQDGQISLKRYKLNVGAPVGDLLSMTHDNIRSWQWVAGYSRIINVIVFDYDWSLTGAVGSYGKREIFTQAASVAKYGKRAPLVIQSRGIRTAAGGAAIALSRATEVARRFAEPPEMLALSTFYQKHPIEAGDQVPVTSTIIPNDKTGLRGLTAEVFETLDVRPNFGPEGGVDLALLWVGSLPVVAAPTSDGSTDTAPAEATFGLVDFVDTTPTLGVEIAGSALTHRATFGAGTPRRSYREAIPFGVYAYTITTGDQVEYYVAFDDTSVDTRGALDLGVVERSSTLQSGSTTTVMHLDSSASATTSYYVNQYFTYDSQTKQVTAYDGFGKNATVAALLSAPPRGAAYKMRGALRFESGVLDQDGLAITPSTAVGAQALGQWKKRVFTLPAIFAGKVLDSAGTGLDTNDAGFVRMQIAGARLLNSSGSQISSLMGGTYTDRVLWALGDEQNVTSTLGAISNEGHSVNTTGVGLLSIGRRAIYRDNAGTATHSTTETIKGTLRNFVHLASVNDSVWFHLKVRLTATNTVGGTLTLTLRLRRGTALGGTEVLRASVTADAGTKGAPATATNVVADFDVDVNSAALLPAPGYQSYVLTSQLSTTGGGGGTTGMSALKIMGVARSR